MPIFISYSHDDKYFATRLAAQLFRHKRSVWIDEWELNVGDSLIERIQDAIQDASALIVILSKSSIQSEWVKKELSVALIRELDEKRVIVLPVLIDDIKRSDIPPFLKDKVYADFRTDFDKGLHDLLNATARITTEGLGRHEDPEFNFDWAIDWETRDNKLLIRIWIVQYAKNDPYSVLTQIHILGNDAATKRYRKFMGRDLDWFQRTTIICMIASFARENDLFLVLEDDFPEQAIFTFNDPRLGITFEVDLTSRRLGEDTGKDIVLNMGGQLADICKAQVEKQRELTEAEAEFVRQNLAK